MPRVYEYKTSGTGNWNVPIHVSEIVVSCVGGGCGGGSGQNIHGSPLSGAGGGGGGSSKTIHECLPGDYLYYSVGAGGIAGAGGIMGGAGGNTFMTTGNVMEDFAFVLAKGAADSTGGVTSTAIGDYKVAGGNGAAGGGSPGGGGGGAASTSWNGSESFAVAGANASGQTGGEGRNWHDSQYGAGGDGGAVDAAGGSAVTAGVYGGGGGGGGGTTSGFSSGGVGAPGRIEISYEVFWETGNIFYYNAGPGTWIVPDDVTEIMVATVGCGGGGGSGGMFDAGGGGGGGASALNEAYAVTPGQTLYYGFTGTGPGASGANGGDVWINTTNSPTSPVVLAKGGSGSTGTAGGAGGSTGSSTGPTKRAGGNGFTTVTSTGGGGGSAAIYYSTGKNATSATGATCARGTAKCGGDGKSGVGDPAIGDGSGGGGGGVSQTGGVGKSGYAAFVYSTLDFPDWVQPEYCESERFDTPTAGSEEWTVPSGCTEVIIICIGGGAGGEEGVGGGGGEGSVTILPVSPNDTLYYFVGEGGAADNPGTASWVNTTDTDVGAVCLANGGNESEGGSGGTGDYFRYSGRDGDSDSGGDSMGVYLSVDGEEFGGEGGTSGTPDGEDPGGGGFDTGSGGDGMVMFLFCGDIDGSGGVVCGGSALAPRQYEDIATGGVVGGGTARVNAIYQITSATGMFSQGPLGPSTTGNDTGVGTVSWSNTGNITVDDSSYATASLLDGCFLAGTLISTHYGSKTIETLLVGDEILSHTGQVATITETRIHNLLCWTLVVADNHEVRTTGNHEFLTQAGFVRVEEIALGDAVFVNGAWSALNKVEIIYEPVVVYDLTVSDPHTYVANGFAVHNK